MRSAPLTKTYGGRKVLDLPEIELPAGQITVVIGANGIRQVAVFLVDTE